MNRSRGNRAFTTFLAVCFATFVALGFGACILICIVAFRVHRQGFGALTAGGNDVRPALVFLALVAAGALAGLWSLRTQWLATRRLTRRVEALSIPMRPDLAHGCERCGLAGRVDLVEAAEPFSFTYGIVPSRIAVSRGLVEAMSASELDAVLEHEHYHLRNRDPLKVLLTRSLTPALFFLPALREFRTRYVTGRELAADRRALRRHGQRSLAGALYKVVAGPTWVELAPAAAIGGGDALDARVTQLETGSEPSAPPLSRRAMILSGVGTAALLSSFLASLYAFGGPSALARLCGGS
ncbi:MAG: M56 family metallopeptidase [Actinobacteria bacterium]|nr:M56 family metallopeptidase [Actinomycetota bacterium]